MFDKISPARFFFLLTFALMFIAGLVSSPESDIDFWFLVASFVSNVLGFFVVGFKQVASRFGKEYD